MHVVSLNFPRRQAIPVFVSSGILDIIFNLVFFFSKWIKNSYLFPYFVEIVLLSEVGFKDVRDCQSNGCTHNLLILFRAIRETEKMKNCRARILFDTTSTSISTVTSRYTLMSESMWFGLTENKATRYMLKDSLQLEFLINRKNNSRGFHYLTSKNVKYI